MNYLPPVNIRVDSKKNVSIDSIDDCVAVDISGALYADIVMFDDIVNANQQSKNIFIIQKNSLIEQVSEIRGETNIGVLVLYLADRIIFVIHEGREFEICEI